MSTLDDWTEALCAELGLEHGTDSARTVLELARVVAHGVDRPAAPLTAYLLGVAVGQGRPAAEACALLARLAAAWGSSADDQP